MPTSICSDDWSLSKPPGLHLPYYLPDVRYFDNTVNLSDCAYNESLMTAGRDFWQCSTLEHLESRDAVDVDKVLQYLRGDIEVQGSGINNADACSAATSMNYSNGVEPDEFDNAFQGRGNSSADLCNASYEHSDGHARAWGETNADSAVRGSDNAAVAGNDGHAVAGNAGFGGHATARNEFNAVAGDDGHAVAEHDNNADGGNANNAVAGNHNNAVAGNDGHAVARDDIHAVARNDDSAVAGVENNAVAGNDGRAVVGNDNNALAGNGNIAVAKLAHCGICHGLLYEAMDICKHCALAAIRLRNKRSNYRSGAGNVTANEVNILDNAVDENILDNCENTLYNAAAVSISNAVVARVRDKIDLDEHAEAISSGSESVANAVAVDDGHASTGDDNSADAGNASNVVYNAVAVSINNAVAAPVQDKIDLDEHAEVINAGIESGAEAVGTAFLDNTAIILDSAVDISINCTTAQNKEDLDEHALADNSGDSAVATATPNVFASAAATTTPEFFVSAVAAAAENFKASAVATKLEQQPKIGSPLSLRNVHCGICHDVLHGVLDICKHCALAAIRMRKNSSNIQVGAANEIALYQTMVHADISSHFRELNAKSNYNAANNNAEYLEKSYSAKPFNVFSGAVESSLTGQTMDNAAETQQLDGGLNAVSKCFLRPSCLICKSSEALHDSHFCDWCKEPAETSFYWRLVSQKDRECDKAEGKEKIDSPMEYCELCGQSERKCIATHCAELELSEDDNSSTYEDGIRSSHSDVEILMNDDVNRRSNDEEIESIDSIERSSDYCEDCDQSGHMCRETCCGALEPFEVERCSSYYNDGYGLSDEGEL